jgi:hypothetical protein
MYFRFNLLVYLFVKNIEKDEQSNEWKKSMVLQ